jgi:PPK2 family polyphosphate:nucleotide phosphotransferase
VQVKKSAALGSPAGRGPWPTHAYTRNEPAASPARPLAYTAMSVTDHDLDAYRYSEAGNGKRFHLQRISPASRPCSSGDRLTDQAALEQLTLKIDDWQNLLLANRDRKLLVVLQGTDASGKDGTVRDVFRNTSPLGVRAIGWKPPTEEDRAHDFLWRIHQRMPAAGEIVVFNRSHYEDVLVPVVNGWITPAQTRQRYAHINDFERLLVETGTTVLKCLLHISKEEQRVRLQARIDDPTKHWKFSLGDLEVREQWDAYQQAYADAISATGTAVAPWIVVPADSKSHRNLMIATLVCRALEGMNLKAPPADPRLAHLKVD